MILKTTLFALILLSATSSYAGPASFDFLDQPSYTPLPLSSTVFWKPEATTWQT